MITRCHHCGAEFDVSNSLVFSRDPSVRCGQCMELFDAKANLYDKNEAAKAAATFKPVNPVKVDKVDIAALENAETIAIEHRYVRANKTDGSAVPDTSYQQPDVDLGAGSEHIPAYAHDSAAAARLEMDQTVAMRSNPQKLSDNLSNSSLESGISEHRFDYSQSQVADSPATSHSADMRMQRIRDRERRALDIEPARGLSAEQMRVVKEYKDRNTYGNDAISNPGVSSADGVMSGVGSTVDEKTKDLEFIPENALQQNTVHRESGWQENSPSFEDGTPKFSMQKPETYAGMTEAPGMSAMGASPAVPTQQSESQQPGLQAGRQTEQQLGWQQQPEPDKPAISEPTASSTQPNSSLAQEHAVEAAHGVQTSDANYGRDVANEAPVSEHHSRRPHSLGANRGAPERRPYSSGSTSNAVQVAETSAQEMRRYLSNRSADGVGRKATDRTAGMARDGAANQSPSSALQTKSSPSNQSNSTWLWVLGLIVVGCVGLYVGRDSVANLELPDAILTPFCQVTGCTPGGPAN